MAKYFFVPITLLLSSLPGFSQLKLDPIIYQKEI